MSDHKLRSKVKNVFLEITILLNGSKFRFGIILEFALNCKFMDFVWNA